MEVNTKSFVEYAQSVFGDKVKNDPELQTSLEKIGQSTFDQPYEERVLDLQAFLVVVAKLLNKPSESDEVLLFAEICLLRASREYNVAANLVRGLRENG